MDKDSLSSIGSRGSVHSHTAPFASPANRSLIHSRTMIPSDLHSIQPVSSLPSIHVAPTDILTVPNFQDQVPADLPPITTQAVPTPTFEEKIKQASLPPPGPSHYDARRALWLTQSNGPPLPPIPSTSRDKLENLLSRRGAAESEEVWNAGVHKVWKALMAGGRFKRRVPMNLVVRSTSNDTKSSPQAQL